MKDFFETKKGILFLNFLKYLFFFASLYVLSIGGVKSEILPFAFGFFVALCWCDQNVFLMSGIYVGASMLSNFSLQNLIISASCSVIIIVCYFIHKKLHARISSVLIGIYAFLSQTVYLVYHLKSIDAIVPSVVYLVLGEIFLYSCIKIFKTLLVKGVGFKLSIDLRW